MRDRLDFRNQAFARRGQCKRTHPPITGYRVTHDKIIFLEPVDQRDHRGLANFHLPGQLTLGYAATVAGDEDQCQPFGAGKTQRLQAPVQFLPPGLGYQMQQLAELLVAVF